MISATTTEQVNAWDFGGYQYGLAPIVMPTSAVRIDDGDLRAVEHQLALLAAATEDPGIRAESAEQLFWFRWIVDMAALEENCVDVLVTASYAAAALQGDHRE